jgi:phytepsin
MIRSRYVPPGSVARQAVDSPAKAYPIAWEIPVDDVFLDGMKLPRSQLSSSNISLSALIDTVRRLQSYLIDVPNNLPLCRAIL